MSNLSDRIKQKQQELYQKRYGTRRDISSEEIAKVNHEAAVQVQKELKDKRDA
jgi:hypothetical protein